MIHLLAYSSSVSSTSLTQINSQTDIFPQDSNSYVLRQNMSLIACAGIGGTLSQLQISQPSLNAVATPFVEPIATSGNPGSNPNVCLYLPQPLPIKGNEDLKLSAANSTSAASVATALLWVQDSPRPVPSGPKYTIRGTASGSSAVAYTWTNIGTITWSTSLAQGTYELVGIRLFSASAIACRAVILGQQFKPGGFAAPAEGNRLPEFFERQGLGGLGSFPSYAMPQIEALCGTTDSSFTAYIDVIKTA